MTDLGQSAVLAPRGPSLWLRVAGDEAVDVRRQAARLSAAVHLFITVAVLWMTVTVQDRALPVLLLAGLVAAGTSAGTFLPWERWRDVRLLWLSAGGLLALALLMAGLRQDLEHALPLYLLEFSYLGLTQPVGCPARMGLLAFGTGSIGVLAGRWPTGLVGLAFVVAVGVITAEVLAAHRARQHDAEQAMQLVLNGVSALTSASTLGELGDHVASYSAQMLAASGVLVLLPQSPGAATFTNVNTRRSPEPAGDVQLTVDQAPGVRLVLESARPLFLPTVIGPLVCGPDDVSRFQIESALLVPLVDGQATAGVLAVFWHTPLSRVDPLLAQGIGLLAQEAGKAAARVWQTDHLTREATTDPLTGLDNRRGFEARLASLQPGDSVVFLDLDHFKALNDTLGHQEGDAELAAFAAALRRQVRAHDCAARYGGEEFVLLLRRGGREGTHRVVASLQQNWAVRGRTTFSAGAAVHVGHREPQETLHRADQALYESKRLGRDRLTWYGAIPEQRGAGEAGAVQQIGI